MTSYETRAAYAADLDAVAHIRTPGLKQAFAAVSREHYLGRGPWLLGKFACSGTMEYVRTATADPTEVYRDVVIAIDSARGLNNGQPSFLAMCWDSVDLKRGARVVHLGCGTGYYTAIAAEVVGSAGRVVAIEVDSQLFRYAQANLAHLPQVHVQHGDGTGPLPNDVDAMFINAGLTDLKVSWLNALAVGGRLLAPMTFEHPLSGQNIGVGKCLLATRVTTGYSARFLFSVGMYHCSSARSVQAAKTLKERFDAGDSNTVRSIRMDHHEPDETCWLHQDAVCLSRAAC